MPRPPRLLGLLVLTIAATGIGVRSAEPVDADLRQQSGASHTLFVPFTGADAVPDIQSHKAPDETGSVCYPIDTAFPHSPDPLQWSGEGPRLTRVGPFGGSQAFFSERLAPTDDLVPVRAYYRWKHLRQVYVDEVEPEYTELGDIVPREVGDGSYVIESWVDTTSIEGIQLSLFPYELELCVEWATKADLEAAATASGGVAITGGDDPIGPVIVLWHPAPGAAAIQGTGSILVAVGGTGMVEPGAQLLLDDPFNPGGFPEVRVLGGPIPDITTITATGLFPGFIEGKTAVTFELTSDRDQFDINLICDTPIGQGPARLQETVRAGATTPFVLNFNTSTLPSGVTIDDFSCTFSNSKPLSSSPTASTIWTVIEESTVNLDRDIITSASTRVTLFNPASTTANLDDWLLCVFYDDGAGGVNAHHEVPLDGLSITAQGSISVSVEEQLTIYQATFDTALDPTVVRFAHTTPVLIFRP